jgi:hypothetical protein
MTANTAIDADSSRRSLSLTVARWSQERAQTTKSLINDMLCRSELSAFGASHLQATRKFLEKAEVKLSRLNYGLSNWLEGGNKGSLFTSLH